MLKINVCVNLTKLGIYFFNLIKNIKLISNLNNFIYNLWSHLRLNFTFVDIYFDFCLFLEILILSMTQFLCGFVPCKLKLGLRLPKLSSYHILYYIIFHFILMVEEKIY
jgi:hypothetical protein